MCNNEICVLYRIKILTLVTWLPDWVDLYDKTGRDCRKHSKRVHLRETLELHVGAAGRVGTRTLLPKLGYSSSLSVSK